MKIQIGRWMRATSRYVSFKKKTDTVSLKKKRHCLCGLRTKMKILICRLIRATLRYVCLSLVQLHVCLSLVQLHVCLSLV
jgi:hypothetical protein